MVPSCTSRSRSVWGAAVCWYPGWECRISWTGVMEQYWHWSLRSSISAVRETRTQMVPFNRGALPYSLCMPVGVGTQALKFSTLSRVVWQTSPLCIQMCTVDPAGFFPLSLFCSLSLCFLSDSLWHQEWNYPTAGSLPGKCFLTSPFLSNSPWITGCFFLLLPKFQEGYLCCGPFHAVRHTFFVFHPGCFGCSVLL